MSGRWLDPVRRALDGLDRPVRVFCRDDDAGWDDDGLWRLIDAVAGCGFTVDVAAIPAAITAATAAGLHRRLAEGTARVHQHGWAHVDHEPEGRACEFGPARSADAQRADVERGHTRLASWFGDAVEPVFTPPWNRCTVHTAQALADAGVRVLSREHRAAPLAGATVAEVPVTLDWQASRRKVALPPEAWAEELATQLGSLPTIGLMSHHATTDGAVLDRITTVLALLRACPQVVPTSLASAALVA